MARPALWRRLALAALIVGAALLAFSPAAADLPAQKSDNIKLVKNFSFTGGGDLAYDGRYVYALQRGSAGGLWVIDPRTLEQIDFFPCGTGTDVKPLERGLIALDVAGACAPGAGIAFLDTTNPKDIQVLGFINASFHTFRNYPGKRIVYLSPNGCCGDLAGGVEDIVDARDPVNPRSGGSYTSNGLGCHDIWIHVKKKDRIAACAAGAETQLWDVSDPFYPRTIARIPTPQTFFNHSAAISSDGKLVVAGDEAHVATECAGGPSGDIWAYDISNRSSPAFQGFFSMSRGTPVSSFWADPQNEWCSAHNYEFIPGTHILVAGWYAGGMNVIDFSEPGPPREIAYYMEDETSVWGAYWVQGRIWTTDDDRGVDVFEVEGLSKTS